MINNKNIHSNEIEISENFKLFEKKNELRLVKKYYLQYALWNHIFNIYV